MANEFYKQEWFWVIIVGVILVIFLTIWLNSSTSSESLITEFLEREGHTIISLDLAEDRSTLVMDGKGSADMQAITGLMGMSRLYPDSKEYNVQIRADIQTCSYTIDSTTAEKIRGGAASLEDFSLMNKFCY